MNRIHIIGGPGSGKTTLAYRLHRLTKLPVFELDAIGYEGGAGPQRPLPAKLADIQRIAEDPKWITEGIFLWWTDALLREADVIVWLDPPWRVACWRILMRYVGQSVRRTNKHKGLRRLWDFLNGARNYYDGPPVEPKALDDDSAVSRSATQVTLVGLGDRVIRVTNGRDLDALVQPFER